MKHHLALEMVQSKNQALSTHTIGRLKLEGIEPDLGINYADIKAAKVSLMALVIQGYINEKYHEMADTIESAHYMDYDDEEMKRFDVLKRHAQENVGYAPVSAKEIEWDLGLNPNQQSRYLKELKKAGTIKVRYVGLPAKRWIKVVSQDTIFAALTHHQKSTTSSSKEKSPRRSSSS